MPNEPKASTDRTAFGGWLLYVALAACPLSKIVAAGLIGGSFTATLVNPWFLVLVVPMVVGGAIAVVRRTRRRRSTGGVTCGATAKQDDAGAMR